MYYSKTFQTDYKIHLLMIKNFTRVYLITKNIQKYKLIIIITINQ